MALFYPDKIRTSNSNAYGIVNANEVSGSRTVSNLEDLYNISPSVLSIDGNGSKSVGNMWYVESESSFYILKDFSQRQSISGWEKFPGGSGVGTVTTVNNVPVDEGTTNITLKGSDISLSSQVTAKISDVIGNDDNSGLRKRISDTETSIGNSESGLIKEVTSLKTTVGGSDSGIVKDLSDLKSLYDKHVTKIVMPAIGEDGIPKTVKTVSDALGDHTQNTDNPHSVTSEQVGLGNVTNDKQIKGLSTGTTENHLVVWGSDGYTVKDANITYSSSDPFVTDSQVTAKIQELASNFLGSFDDWSKVPSSTSIEFQPSMNDYIIVTNDDGKSTHTLANETWRYKYSKDDSEEYSKNYWLAEYKISNTLQIAGKTASGTLGGIRVGDNLDIDSFTGVLTSKHPVITINSNDTTTSEPSFGGTFTAISSIDKDSNGHVTKITTKTVTIPNSIADTSKSGLLSNTDKAELNRLSSAIGSDITSSNQAASKLYVDGSLPTYCGSFNTYADIPTSLSGFDADKQPHKNSYLIVKSDETQTPSGQTWRYVYTKEVNTASTYNKIYWAAEYQISTEISDMTGASSAQDGKHGLVPKPVKGDQSKFLRGDGTWQTVSSSSGVTSVNTKTGTVTLYGTDIAISDSDSTTISASLSSKQSTLVSGTNIKTINNEPILGEGNIDISSSSTPFQSINDKHGNLTAVALGQSTGLTFGKNSFSNGEFCEPSGDYSHSLGNRTIASANYSLACGNHSKVDTEHLYSFCWNGINSDTYYVTKGIGTFCINPIDGINGFYIGSDNLATILNNNINTVNQNGCVVAPTTDNPNKVYATDSNGNPGWSEIAIASDSDIQQILK